MWSLRPEHFKMIYGCLPPFPKQAAIVRFLDHADRRIRRVTYISSLDLTFGSKQDNVTTAAGRRLHQIDRRFPYLVDRLSRGSKKYIASIRSSPRQTSASPGPPEP